MTIIQTKLRAAIRKERSLAPNAPDAVILERLWAAHTPLIAQVLLALITAARAGKPAPPSGLPGDNNSQLELFGVTTFTRPLVLGSGSARTSIPIGKATAAKLRRAAVLLSKNHPQIAKLRALADAMTPYLKKHKALTVERFFALRAAEKTDPPESGDAKSVATP